MLKKSTKNDGANKDSSMDDSSGNQELVEKINRQLLSQEREKMMKSGLPRNTAVYDYS